MALCCLWFCNETVQVGFFVVVSLMWIQRARTEHRMGVDVVYGLGGMKSGEQRLATGHASDPGMVSVLLARMDVDAVSDKWEG